MPHLDRDSFIALLDRLGDADDAAVLAAARAIDARVRDAGLDWNNLLVPPPAAAADEPEPMVGDAPPETDGEPDAAECAHDLALIDALLARPSLSAETRTELEDMRQQITAGTHSRMDSRYLRGLHARLGAGAAAA